MADVVQYRMEKMVDELDDLERRGLFTRREIAEIVKKRRDFEFRIKRRCPLKQDFISYIDYETQVDKLRKLRKQLIIGKLKQQRMEEEEKKLEESEEDEQGKGLEKRGTKKSRGGKLWKKSISDWAGVRNILTIYRKATSRYKGDLDLWFKYLEFCRERRHGWMKEALVTAIRLHPMVPGLWMYAAAWEFDQNLNVAAARALMQNGLRVCHESEDLWIEYLRMELTYLNKLKARKVALGEDVCTLSQNGDSKDENVRWKDQNKEQFMPITEEKGDDEGLDLSEIALEKKENFFWEQGSIILRTIYHGASKALPSSLSLRKRFLDILDEVDLAHSDELKGDVIEDLKMNFSKDESFWDWFARSQIQCNEIGRDSEKEEAHHNLSKAVQVYEDALDILPSTKMFNLYSKFLLDIIVPKRSDTISILCNVEVDHLEFGSRLLKVYERAESSNHLNEDLAHQYVTFYLQLGKLEEARVLAGRLCNGSLSHAAKLWILRVSIEIKHASDEFGILDKSGLDSVFELLRLGLAKSTFSEAEELWLLAIRIFSNSKKHFKTLVNDLIIMMSSAYCDGSGCSVCSAILNQVIQRDGIQQARDLYRRFLALPRPSYAFFKHCIEMESNLASVGDKDALSNARKVYESALNAYIGKRELWKDYYKFETKVGTSKTVNALHWRARKALGDITELLSSS